MEIFLIRPNSMAAQMTKNQVTKKTYPNTHKAICAVLRASGSSNTLAILTLITQDKQLLRQTCRIFIQ